MPDIPSTPVSPRSLPDQAVDALLRATRAEPDLRLRLRDEALLAQRRFKVLDGEWASEELGRFFWLAPEDMLQAKTCRGAANRLGFALGLLLFPAEAAIQK